MKLILECCLILQLTNRGQIKTIIVKKKIRPDFDFFSDSKTNHGHLGNREVTMEGAEEEEEEEE